MTESEWFAATDPEILIEYLDAAGKLGNRKFGLYFVACVRHLGPPYPENVDPALLSEEERRLDNLDGLPVWRDDELSDQLDRLRRMDRLLSLDDAVAEPAEEARPHFAAIFRDIYRHPAKETPPALAAWRTGKVISLALAIYEAREFDRLPLLADAMEDAGCADVELLGHLREPGVHCRGCWAVDLLLGKS